MKNIRRSACWIFLLMVFASSCEPTDRPAEASVDQPNIIIVLADDLGYGDLSCFGSTRIKTPALDRIAAEGVKMTNFYAFPSCSPSRAALLTGCYPYRVGIPDVIGPPGPAWTATRQYGLDPATTETIADLLQATGYATGLIGKWHLGHFAETMPLNHGFDYFYGLPYSNDIRPENGRGYPDLVLLRNLDTVSVNPDQTDLTAGYYREAKDFISRHADSSFFLYLAHNMPHVPLYNSAAFKDRSGQGTYADVVEEIDAGIGELLDLLEELDIDDNTLVVFTSDNGPWLTYGNHAGSAGPFREGKGTVWEGGMRVPLVARWPAGIEGGQIAHYRASLLDLLPTAAELVDTETSREVDGRSLVAAWRGKVSEPDEPFYYYQGRQLKAVRRGPWKLHLPHRYRTVDSIAHDGNRGIYRQDSTSLTLYHLGGDAGERYDRAQEYPDLVEELRQFATDFSEEVEANRSEPWRAEE